MRDVIPGFLYGFNNLARDSTKLCAVKMIECSYYYQAVPICKEMPLHFYGLSDSILLALILVMSEY